MSITDWKCRKCGSYNCISFDNCQECEKVNQENFGELLLKSAEQAVEISRQLEDGIYVHKVHGRDEFFKIIDNQPHILSKNKGKEYWCPTIIPENRLKKARKLSEFEMFRRMK